MNKKEVLEQELVSKALAGDTVSFGLLYERYLDEIYQFVFYRVKSHQEAEDLTEAAFFKAWQALDENPPQEVPFRLWLYRIARNSVIDHYRTRREQVSLDAAEELAGTHEGPETLVVRREREEELRDRLQSLNEDHQEVLTCRFVMGLSHAETAVVMLRSEQAVRALQYRAIVTLRNLMTLEDAKVPLFQNGNGTKNAKVVPKASNGTLTKEESNYV